MILNAFLALYRLVWVVLTPVVLVYLWRRGQRDPLYGQHLRERFGSYGPLPRSPVWIHAVSLGETRSAVPLARALLDRGENVVFTHFTPAGRREAMRVFAPDIAAGRVGSVWVPLDMLWVYARFFAACHPKIGLTMEIEVWPAMIFASKRARVPLFMCNGQYSRKSLARDGRGLRLRQRIMTGLSGVMVKSQVQADRFASIGVTPAHVTGELRFEQPVPAPLLAAAKTFAPTLGARRVVTIASAVEGEDAIYIDTIKALRASGDDTLFIYVPRAPERFGDVAGLLTDAGLTVARRSDVFDATLHLKDWPVTPDVLLGDSMGEMYFYLSLSARVIVGGGFLPHGAHNIIEPLALGKPVVTGPHTHIIEYPFVEAEAAGVALSVPDTAGLIAALSGDIWTTPKDIAAFMAAHGGASAKTLALIEDYL